MANDKDNPNATPEMLWKPIQQARSNVNKHIESESGQESLSSDSDNNQVDEDPDERDLDEEMDDLENTIGSEDTSQFNADSKQTRLFVTNFININCVNRPPSLPRLDRALRWNQ
jgi:hypothetical protein